MRSLTCPPNGARMTASLLFLFATATAERRCASWARSVSTPCTATSWAARAEV